MRKLPVFLLLFAMTLPVWAQIDNAVPAWALVDEYDEPEMPDGFRMKNRMIEMSVGQIELGASTNFLGAVHIFKNPFALLCDIPNIIDDITRIYQDPVVVNIDDLLNGFKFNLNGAIEPLSFNFNWKDQWGIGLDIGHIDVWGNVAVPRDVLRFGETSGKTFGAGAAAFVDVGIPFFFHTGSLLKVKVRPAIYAPIIYAQPSFRYRYQKSDNEDSILNGMNLDIDFNTKIYSLVDLYDVPQSFLDNGWNILKENVGYDFDLRLEYPWDYGLDIGVDITHIPIWASTLNYYTEFTGTMSFDSSAITSLDLDEIFSMDGFELASSSGKTSKSIYRPFTVLFFADYRPLDTRPLSLIPSLGFSVNQLYTQPVYIEGGMSARYDIANIFIPSIGIHFNDRTFINSFAFILNLRALELALGISTQSPHFIKSWQGAGLGVQFGLKFGW